MVSVVSAFAAKRHKCQLNSSFPNLAQIEVVSIFAKNITSLFTCMKQQKVS